MAFLRRATALLLHRAHCAAANADSAAQQLCVGNLFSLNMLQAPAASQLLQHVRGKKSLAARSDKTALAAEKQGAEDMEDLSSLSGIFEGSVRWPLPDDALKANPQLAQALRAHNAFAKESLAERLEERIQQRLPGRRPGAISKTAILKLKVDELRRDLEAGGHPTHGNKEELAERLMDLLGGPGVGPGPGATAGPLTVAESPAAAAAAAGREAGGGVGAGKGASTREAPLTGRQRRVGRAEVVKPPVQPPPPLWEGAGGVAESAALRQQHFETVFTPEEVGEVLLEARAADVTVIDVRGRCAVAHHIVVATGRSLRHVYACAQAVLYQLRQRVAEVAPGVKTALQGRSGDQWVAVDAGSVLVHVMTEDMRAEVDLEGLWVGGPESVRVLLPKGGAVQTLQTIKADS